MEISLFIFLGLQISPFFFSCDFWVFTRKNAEISILNCDFSIIFFGWTNSLFSFFSCDFSVFTRRMNFSLFLVGKFSVLLCSTAIFSSFTRRSEETCFLNRFEFSFVQTTCPFCTKLEWNKNIILGISLFFGWRFLHFLTVNCSCYPRESNSLHSEARFSLFFSFSAFFSRRMQQSPIFLLSLTFCQKKLEQGSTLQHGETAIENGDVESFFGLSFWNFLE